MTCETVHGTNAAVSIQKRGKELLCQRRNDFVGQTQTHYGFTLFVKQHADYFLSLYHRRNLFINKTNNNIHNNNDINTQQNDNEEDITIFGEWCGKNIMQGTAICKLTRNIFAVFAIQVSEHSLFFLIEFIQKLSQLINK